MSKEFLVWEMGVYTWSYNKYILFRRRRSTILHTKYLYCYENLQENQKKERKKEKKKKRKNIYFSTTAH
jgi:hypothetical protein